jgi:hypothetical protein
MTVRPAHLNLDVRHTFSSLDLTVTVDGERELHASLEGGGKRFKVFGERAERGYTRTLNLAPGVRLVGVRVRSAGDRFDQTRVERFELGSSAVAVMRIAADRSGLQVVAERPPELPPAARAPATAAPSPPAALHMAPPLAPVQAAAAPKNTGAVVELLQSLRSMLIAIAGFVASAATGFVVQEYLRKRKEPTFAEANRRRRRAGFAG